MALAERPWGVGRAVLAVCAVVLSVQVVARQAHALGGQQGAAGELSGRGEPGPALEAVQQGGLASAETFLAEEADVSRWGYGALPASRMRELLQFNSYTVGLLWGPPLAGQQDLSCPSATLRQGVGWVKPGPTRANRPGMGWVDMERTFARACACSHGAPSDMPHIQVRGRSAHVDNLQRFDIPYMDSIMVPRLVEVPPNQDTRPLTFQTLVFTASPAQLQWSASANCSSEVGVSPCTACKSCSDVLGPPDATTFWWVHGRTGWTGGGGVCMGRLRGGVAWWWGDRRGVTRERNCAPPPAR